MFYTNSGRSPKSPPLDEVYAKVVEKNPAQPEFHQAVKEVLESLRVVIEANEEIFTGFLYVLHKFREES